MKNRNKIKVLHVAPLPPPLGGMVTYMIGLLSSDVFKEIEYKVVRSSYINKENYNGLARNLINIANAVVITCIFIFRTISWMPNIVHIQSNSGFGYFEKSWIAFLAKLFGCRTLFHFHGGNFPTFYGNSSKLTKSLITKAALINNRIITGSPQMKSNWVNIGIPLDRISYIGNAINLPVINPKSVIHSTTILILTRIVIEKGMIELIDAFLKIRQSTPGIYLRIAGAESKDSPFIKKHIEENDIFHSIFYIGSISEEQKQFEFQNADIFAFPTHFEDQSYAVMEAMSYGLPCVASNVGGVPSLINDGVNGVLVEPKNVDSLKHALELLLLDIGLRTRLGQNARKTIEDGFTWEIRSKEIISMYNEVLKEKNSMVKL